MPYFAYIVGGWVQKEGKFCLRNKSMAPSKESLYIGEPTNSHQTTKKFGCRLELD